MSKLYQHPDGYSIAYCDGKLVCNDGIDTILIPIGPDGLHDLAKKLVKLADKLTYMEYEDILCQLQEGGAP